MGYSPAALVVATHPQQCRSLVACLEGLGLKPALAFTVADALNALASPDVAMVCCAPKLLDGTYRDLLPMAHRRSLPVVLISRQGDWAEFMEAMQEGVFDCLAFPFSDKEAARVLGNAARSCMPPARRAASA